jgi:hypothetical protein
MWAIRATPSPSPHIPLAPAWRHRLRPQPCERLQHACLCGLGLVARDAHSDTAAAATTAPTTIDSTTDDRRRTPLVDPVIAPLPSVAPFANVLASDGLHPAPAPQSDSARGMPSCLLYRSPTPQTCLSHTSASSCGSGSGFSCST